MLQSDAVYGGDFYARAMVCWCSRMMHLFGVCVCVCIRMYDYHIVVSIKTLARVCMCVCVCVRRLRFCVLGIHSRVERTSSCD